GKCTNLWPRRHVEADRPCEAPEGDRGAEETSRSVGASEQLGGGAAFQARRNPEGQGWKGRGQHARGRHSEEGAADVPGAERQGTPVAATEQRPRGSSTEADRWR
ncbi:unnamed protein product, partial [Ectocarpus sp. 12 AP-2014]